MSKTSTGILFWQVFSYNNKGLIAYACKQETTHTQTIQITITFKKGSK